MQPGGVAVADIDEGARALVQHVGEVLRAHHRGAVGVDLVGAGDLAGDRSGERGFPLLVDQDRVAAGIGQGRLGAIKPRGALDHLAHAPLQEIAHLRRQAARGAVQSGVLGDDVAGDACLEHADRHHRGVERIDVARHHRLQLVDDLRADENAVDREMRPRRMAADAFDVDRDVVGRRHHGAGANGELPRPAGRDNCACRTPDRCGSGRSGRRAPWRGRRRRPPRPAGRSRPPCRRNCAFRRGIWRRRAAWRCGRHGRRRASCPAPSSGNRARSPPRSAARPCRRAGRPPCRRACPLRSCGRG